MAWYYLSFAGEEGFRGACIVEAIESMNAVAVATRLGINPGGEVVIVKAPAGPCPLPVNRLLTKADLGIPLSETETAAILADESRTEFLHDRCNSV